MAWNLYRHTKGNHYLRLGVAAHSEDLSPQVVYRCLYDNPEARTWVRPQPMFEGAIADGRQRFTPVGRLRLVQPEDMRAVLAFGYGEWKQDKTFDQPIVTEVLPRHNYSAAEAYHQDFFEKNPNQGYCVAVAGPKVAKFRKTFKELVRE